MDLRVAQAVSAVRALEMAYHDSGPWTISLGAVTAPAVRFVTPDRVIFRAHFPDACLLDPPEEPVFALACKGQIVAVRPGSQPEDGEFVTEWIFALPRENVPV